MSIIEKFEATQVAELTKDKNTPEFRPGDTLKVGVKIIEGKTERLQYFQGLCIARSNSSINSTFTVRKISNGEGVERKFPLYSPRIDSIEVIRKGVVKRAKLYYMRKLQGKAARIKEKQDFLNKKSDPKKIESKGTDKKADTTSETQTTNQD